MLMPTMERVSFTQFETVACAFDDMKVSSVVVEE